MYWTVKPTFLFRTTKNHLEVIITWYGNSDVTNALNLYELHLGVIFIAFDSQVPESSIVTFSSWDLHSIHSKNSRFRNNLDLGPRGLDPFLGLFNPESVSMWPGFCIIVTRNLVKCGDFDSDSGTRWQGFRVKVTQKWAWPTGTKIRINSDPGVLRVL